MGLGTQTRTDAEWPSQEPGPFIIGDFGSVADSAGVVGRYPFSSFLGVVSGSFMTRCLDDRRPRFLMVWCDFVNLLTNPSKNTCFNVQHKLSREVEKQVWYSNGSFWLTIASAHMNDFSRNAVLLSWMLSVVVVWVNMYERESS